MPRLPGPEALGALPSMRSGASPAQIDKTDPVAGGLGRVGGALATVGKEQRDKEETYEVERRVLEFGRNEERALEDTRRTMGPGGAGFADAYRSGYDTRARELFGRARQEGLSHTALQRLDVALLRAGENLQTRAYRFQRDEEDRFNRDDVTTRLNGIISDVAGRSDLIERAPEYLERARREAEALIGSSRLSAADRYTVRRTFQREFERSIIDSMVAGADTPERREEARRLLLGSRRLAQPPGRRDRSGRDFERTTPPGEGEPPPPTTTTGAGRLPPDTPPPTGRGVSELVDRSRETIGRLESGERVRPYQTTVESTSPTRGRQEALGRYGIMDFNLAEWSRAALGRTVTREEFLSSPEIQDRIFNHRFGILLREENGDVGNAAQRWFAGSLTNREADRFGTRGLGYRERFLRYFNEGSGPPPPTTTEGRPPPPTTEPPPTTPPPPPTGLVRAGQGIDLDNIIFVRTPDGAPTRVRTFVMENEGRFFVVPRFDEQGRPLTEAQAREQFLRTGGHLGEFDTQHNAAAHARALWEGPPQTPPPTPGAGGPGEQGPGTGGRGRVRFEGETPPTTEPPISEGGLWRSTRGGALTAATRRIDLLDRQEAARLEQDITSWERLAGEGRAPPVAEMLRVAQALENVRDPVVRDHYQAVLNYARRTHELMQMRPAALENAVRAERERQNREGASPVAARWLASWERLLEHTNTQIRTNTIDWAQRLGIIDAGGVRFDDDGSMRAHAARVGMVDGALGRASPRIFTNGQRDEAVGILRQGGRPMLEMLGSMTRNWGPEFTRRAINEIATAEGRTGDAPELALIGQLYLSAQANPALRRVVEDAAEAVRLRTADANVRTTMGTAIPRNERRDAASILGSAFQLSSESREAALAVADLVYYRRASAGTGRDLTTFNPTLYRQVLQEVLGQSTERNVTYGGIHYQGWGSSNPILVPPNMRQDGVRTALEGLRLQDLIDEHGFGPVGSDGRYLTPRQLRDMTLVSAGNGRYWIAQGDPTGGAANWVQDGTGRPFELDLNRLQPILQQRAPEIYRGYVEAVPGSGLTGISGGRPGGTPGAGAIAWLRNGPPEEREMREREFDRLYGRGRARATLEALAAREGNAAPSNEPPPPRETPPTSPVSGAGNAERIWEPGSTTPTTSEAVAPAAEELRLASSRGEINRLLDRYTIRADESGDEEERDVRRRETRGELFGMYSHRRSELVRAALQPYFDSNNRIRTDLTDPERAIVARLVPVWNGLVERYNADMRIYNSPRRREYHQRQPGSQSSRIIEEFLAANPDTHPAPPSLR